MDEDYEMAKGLISDMNLSEDKLLPRPETGEDYVNMINSFDAIIGARLHSCITAFSLGIPVAGLLWDDKLRFFSKSMGIQDFFTEEKDLDANLIVDRLEAAMLFKNHYEDREKYKKKTLDYIKRFLLFQY